MDELAALIELRAAGEKLKSLLGLSASAVGVKLLKFSATDKDSGIPLSHHRYCQALMKARHGASVSLDSEGIACPAAAAAFGFKPLPEGLQTGKALVGFGIVTDSEVGKHMFLNMPKLSQGEVEKLHLIATDIRSGEALLGFPGHFLAPIVAHLEHLSEKAIPTSRSKRALQSLQRETAPDNLN